MNAYLFIHYDRKFIRIRLDEILYVFAEGQRSKIVTGNATYLPHLQIGKLEKCLPPDHFLRINRSTIVPLDKITWFTKEEVSVNGQVIGIGGRYLDDLKGRICLPMFCAELK
ncbi:MAG: LytTR family transcriptional regulator DNA-binding domain-containing protein [Sphingobacteriales bacterium]|nr:LytTR family transcriptional regulator DNA-binding domain-containing protein [Sphingobacteriales bacterium]OJW00258.1 MAG: hypothetical protein BGO52_03995 [Sphingobacteriales bacterium 44-61]